MSRRRKWSAALLIASAAMLALPVASIAVTVTLGPTNLSMPSTGFFECSGCQSVSALNTAPVGGTLPVAPADGTISSWRVLGAVQHGSLHLFVLRPQADGSFTGGTISSTGAVDGTPNPTSQALAVGETIGVFLLRQLPFEAGDHARVDTVESLGASWSELGVYGEGINRLPIERFLNQELLLNATVELFPPGMSKISPSSGTGGTVVTITGQHLAVATGVTFGGVPASAFSGNDEQVTAVAPPRPEGGTVDVQVTTAGGTTAALPLDLFTYPSPAGSSTTHTTATNPDRTPPTVSALSLSPASFRAANIGGSIIASRVGSRVSHRLSEAATMTFTVQRALAGRRSGRRCVAPSKANRAKRRCTRLKGLPGSFSRSGAAGANSFIFSGRLRNRALTPGGYRLLTVAQDAAGNRSQAISRAFTILH